MAWPVTSRFQDFVDGTTNVVAAFLHAVQDAIVGVYGGGKTLKSVQVDGTGDAAATASPGDVVASGNVVAGGALSAPQASIGSQGIALGIGATPSGYTLHGAVQTVNNSIISIVTFALPSNKAFVAVARVVGLKSDFTAGGAYVVKGTFKNAGGVLTPIGGGGGTTLISEDEDDGTWGGVGFLNAGSNISVTVQGKAATTINWKCVVDITMV